MEHFPPKFYIFKAITDQVCPEEGAYDALEARAERAIDQEVDRRVDHQQQMTETRGNDR